MRKKKFLSVFSFFRWRNARIGQKYLTSFFLAALLFFIAGTLVYFQLSHAQDDIDEYEEETVRIQDMTQLSLIMHNKDIQIADYIITKNSRYIDRFNEILNEFDQLYSVLETSMNTEQEQAIFNLIKDNDAEINNIFFDIVDHADNQYTDEYLTAIRNKSDGLRSATVDAINMLIDAVNEEQVKKMDNAQESMSKSVLFLYIANLSAIGFGVLIIFFVSRNITTNLNKVVNMTTEIANGNLAVESVTYRGNDEIGQLAKAVNNMKESIANILQNVRNASIAVTTSSDDLTQSANEVKEGSDQIATTMVEIATGAETQAVSASDLLESMNEFVTVVQKSEREGQEVAQTSDHVRIITNDGADLMKQSVAQMNQIDEIVSNAVEHVKGLDQQSAEISNLVLVVKNIAEQTNLLALNAAIEAARAGEYGQGFAVVADEVRKLAEQVTASVSEITNIVTQIQAETGLVVQSLSEGYEEVKEGTNQIEKTGQNFAEIDHSISDMVTKINSISVNLKNIVQNSAHMNTLIEDIASVSEESAAGVEEAAASSQQTSSVMDEVSNNAEELAILAEQLNDEIAVFQIDDIAKEKETSVDDDREHETPSDDEHNEQAETNEIELN